MRSKTQLLKTASIGKQFSTKIKTAQENGTLTPEVVQEMGQDILEVVGVIEELAAEIVEGVPAEEEGRDALGNREEGPEQIEVAAEETEEEKKKRMEKEKTAQDKDDDKKEDKEKIAKLEVKLANMERIATLAKLAPKYASLFPKQMHEAKMNEILESKQPLNIVEAKIQEASDIIQNKTMVKIASMMDSPYDFNDSTDGGEIDFSDKI